MTVVAVVPTLGATPLLADCLRALRAQAPRPRVVVVHAGQRPLAAPRELADELVELGAPSGFAASTNRGVAAATAAAHVAVVNDDAVVEPGWLAALLRALEEAPRAGAVQGVNVTLDGTRVDGAGIAWKRRLEAVQLGHGEPAGATSAAPDAPRQIFGVSATAALYRRAALDAVATPVARPFDQRLGSWYEDVDLAARLRQAGWDALLVPSARARHAGTSTGAGAPLARARRLHANRHLVLARLLGRAYLLRLPVLVVPDLRELLAALLHGDGRTAAGILLAMPRVLAGLPRWAHLGPARLPLAELAAALPREAR